MKTILQIKEFQAAPGSWLEPCCGCFKNIGDSDIKCKYIKYRPKYGLKNYHFYTALSSMKIQHKRNLK